MRSDFEKHIQYMIKSCPAMHILTKIVFCRIPLRFRITVHLLSSTLSMPKQSLLHTPLTKTIEERAFFRLWWLSQPHPLSSVYFFIYHGNNFACRIFRWINLFIALSISSSIWFQPRPSVVSVYVKKCRSRNEQEEEKMRFTVFSPNASIRCCAPSSPIEFLWILSVVSICVKHFRLEDEEDENKIRFHCVFA